MFYIYMMKNEYIEKAKRLSEQEKNIAKNKWQCMCPHCSDSAINSHLLQRHGLLSHIVENGHLYEIGREDFYRWDEKSPIKIKKVGLQQAISFPLFCNKHDTELFAPIEGNLIDFDDYRSQLLFSYRGLCSEIRKKEFNQIRNVAFDEGEIKDAVFAGTECGLKDLQYYKYLFEQELDIAKQKFEFFHISYPLIKVCASGAVSYEQIDYGNELSEEKALMKKVWDSFFINIIPQEKTLEIIIGYHKNHVNSDLRKYVESWQKLSFEELQVKITDLFASKLETWCISPSLYESISDEKKQKFMDIKEDVQLDFFYDIRNEVDFNLFADSNDDAF